ncbi:MAG: XdhC family protein [Thermodesulfobacteriota bacterium]|nr:XdhC family protein [Thermodesulfobacteriota bacterium]
MNHIYTRLLESCKKGSVSVLATIVRQAGPSPRGAGSKCLIMDDGSFTGTVGGGIIEARTLEQATKVFDTGLPVRLKFSLDGSDVAETDMLCGGQVEIFLEPVSPENLICFSILREITRIINHGGAGLLATVLDEDRWKQGKCKMFLDRDGDITGRLAGTREFEKAISAKMERVLAARQPEILHLQDDKGNPVEVFVEPILSDPVLYVFGGGHVSRQIVPLARRVGFQVVVIDDREEFASVERFPTATEVRLLPLEGVLDKIVVDESSYLVIVTRGHVHDKSVLAQALKTNARYIGMIGSSRKTAIIHEKLLEEGFTEANFSRVHAPIGLEIGAETPAEIAVSIVAELIKVRAG